ncbi:MAG: hypothetical protein NVS2B12_21340 [Ktedonobacteraceae bacterium]
MSKDPDKLEQNNIHSEHPSADVSSSAKKQYSIPLAGYDESAAYEDAPIPYLAPALDDHLNQPIKRTRLFTTPLRKDSSSPVSATEVIRILIGIILVAILGAILGATVAYFVRGDTRAWVIIGVIGVGFIGALIYSQSNTPSDADKASWFEGILLGGIGDISSCCPASLILVVGGFIAISALLLSQNVFLIALAVGSIASLILIGLSRSSREQMIS